MEKDVAILMADLTGYTAMTDVHGGLSAAKIVGRYLQLVDQSLVGSTQMVQRIGDQIVLMSDNPPDILTTAERLIDNVNERHFLSVHMGIHYGTILIDNGNFFGSTINIASRIMNMANSSQVLCSSAYVNQLPSDFKLKFNDFGRHKFKNVLSEVEIFELCNSMSSKYYLDPVCHMLVDPRKDFHIVTFKEQTFHFCSEYCMTLFNSSPSSFIQAKG